MESKINYELTVGIKKGAPTEMDNYEVLVVNFNDSDSDLIWGWMDDSPKHEGKLFVGKLS